MASIISRNGRLYLDFRYKDIRCREKTFFKDNSKDRKALEKIAKKIEAEIFLDTFVFEEYFPKSKKLKEIQSASKRTEISICNATTFNNFSSIWYEDKQVEWRYSYKSKIKQILDGYLIPYFNNIPINNIKREDLLAFRTSLTKVKFGKNNKPLSQARINSIMVPLRMILEEASLRYDFECPYKSIKQLKEPKREVKPFTLDEVWLFINNVRADYKNYYTVRFFTGMRTGEIDGLQWKYIDFNRREVLIRETYVNGRMDTTKTKESSREIHMSEVVYNALLEQKKATHGKSDFVFCNTNGEVLSYSNVTKRVWKPTLELLGLEQRRAYETRHTAATLWLAAGENPEWIARQMGHTTTKMLFNVYSRYVPDKTRQDGSAFDSLLRISQKTQ